jgi:hypothetical protein
VSAAQRQDGVGAAHSPEHAGLLETRADDGFAAGLDNAGANEPMLATELRVAQQQIERALQLALPILVGEPIPILYIQWTARVPVVRKETTGRKGKTDGELAHTREAKQGCVFPETSCDREGFPIRDPESTTCTGAIETAEEFGRRLYREAWNRGLCRARKIVILGDGAEWIRNLAELHFPDAIHIVDLYHARQRLWDVARALFPNDPISQKAWMKVHQKRLLDKGKIEKLVASLRSLLPAHPEAAEKLQDEADYFEKNAERMCQKKKPTRSSLLCRAPQIGFGVDAARPSGGRAAQTLAAGYPPGRSESGASGCLSRRVHLPLQPAQIAQPGQAVLPASRTSCCRRADSLQILGQVFRGPGFLKPQNVGVTGVR